VAIRCPAFKKKRKALSSLSVIWKYTFSIVNRICLRFGDCPKMSQIEAEKHVFSSRVNIDRESGFRVAAAPLWMRDAVFQRT
jgi:hypothetical protein